MYCSMQSFSLCWEFNGVLELDLCIETISECIETISECQFACLASL